MQTLLSLFRSLTAIPLIIYYIVLLNWKRILGLIAVVIIIFGFSDYYFESKTWEEHLRCAATILPVEHRRGMSGSLEHHIKQAVRKAKESGITMSETEARQRAFLINMDWVKSADNNEDFSNIMLDRLHRCSKF